MALRTYGWKGEFMDPSPYKSPRPSSLLEIRGAGFPPPPPKGVRMWCVLPDHQTSVNSSKFVYRPASPSKPRKPFWRQLAVAGIPVLAILIVACLLLVRLCSLPDR
jgi:hypothetical protein